MIVKICGVPYRIEYCDENFSYDEHLGRIIYSEGVIRINKSCTEDMRKEVLYHELVHGILWHTGQYTMHNDEPLVQALANAIYNMFELKTMDREENDKKIDTEGE